MTGEAVLKIETHIPINYTCSTLVTMEKGAILKLTDPMTAVLSDGENDLVAGIGQSEKLALDTTQDSVSVYRGGIFSAVAGVAGVIFGEAVIIDVGTSGANRLVKADNQSEQIFGICLQTASSGNRFLFELGPRAIQLT